MTDACHNMFFAKWTKTGQYDHAIDCPDASNLPDTGMVQVCAIFGAAQIAQRFPERAALDSAERLAWFYSNHKLWLADDGKIYFFTEFNPTEQPLNPETISPNPVFNLSASGQVLSLWQPPEP